MPLRETSISLVSRHKLLAFLAISFMCLTGLPSSATPLIALKEADNCQGCHTKGRSQRPFLERRCTLDCQGCHIDPAGAGPRNQWGVYNAEMEANLYTWMKTEDPLKDTSRFDLHYDGRIIQRSTANSERTFPMSSEFTLRVRPFVTHLHLVYQAQFFGRPDDMVFRQGERRQTDKYSIMIDALPLNLYVRAYRGAPMYGLRRPNHSLWIRERLGLDQFALTDAVEFGGTPNVPFFRTSYMSGDPRAEPEDQQKGVSMHGGFRGVSFGWHVNGSYWRTASPKSTIEMSAIGGGLKPKWFLLYGERNHRLVTPNADADRASFVSQAPRSHPSSRIDEWTAAFSGIRGVIAGIVQEELHDATQDSMRRSLFIDLHPVPFLQFEIWRRFETGTRDLVDTLAVMHFYLHF